jgi:hypothetical protein
MQEKYLARRTLHFVEGGMVWWCCQKIFGQGGLQFESMDFSWEVSGIQLKLLARAFEQAWDLEALDLVE